MLEKLCTSWWLRNLRQFFLSDSFAYETLKKIRAHYGWEYNPKQIQCERKQTNDEQWHECLKIHVRCLLLIHIYYFKIHFKKNNTTKN